LKKKFDWRAPLLFALLTFLLLIVAYLGAGYLVYVSLTRVQARCESPFLEGKRDNTPSSFFARYGDSDLIVDDEPYRMPEYETVEFLARDEDIQIRGWFVPSEAESKQVVIVVHGLRMCRHDPTVLIPAGMLHRNDFNVLLIDLRNHGDSQITDGRTAAGNREFRDILGAFDWLLARGYESGHIGILGISLGGGASLIAFGAEPQVAAIWVDSTFADIREVLEDELKRNHYPSLVANAGDIVARIAGINLTEYSPLISIQNHHDRPIFITHGTDDLRLKVNFAQDLFAAAGSHAELWLVPELDHVEAIYRIPDEYEKRMVRFFEGTLGN
jgi:fermentation-respiration switch protein FrsA (DUF1100 family)